VFGQGAKRVVTPRTTFGLPCPNTETSLPPVKGAPRDNGEARRRPLTWLTRMLPLALLGILVSLVVSSTAIAGTVVVTGPVTLAGVGTTYTSYLGGSGLQVPAGFFPNGRIVLTCTGEEKGASGATIRAAVYVSGTQIQTSAVATPSSTASLFAVSYVLSGSGITANQLDGNAWPSFASAPAWSNFLAPGQNFTAPFYFDLRGEEVTGTMAQWTVNSCTADFQDGVTNAVDLTGDGLTSLEDVRLGVLALVGVLLFTGICYPVFAKTFRA